MKIFTTISTFFLRIFGVIQKPDSSVSPEQTNSMKQIVAHHQSSAHELIAGSVNITENGLSGPCKTVTLIFAKGTGEKGNMGGGSSPGPAWVEVMRNSIGEANLTVQGLDYDASIFGYLGGGDHKGSKRYSELTSQVATKCPETKIVLGGYSQGAQVVHNAALKFSSATVARICAAVLFGDPYLHFALGDIPSSRVLNICHRKDIICKGKGGIVEHLTYSKDASDAADFVLARI